MGEVKITRFSHFFSIKANFYDFLADKPQDTVHDFAGKFFHHLNQQNYQHWAQKNFDLKNNQIDYLCRNRRTQGTFINDVRFFWGEGKIGQN